MKPFLYLLIAFVAIGCAGSTQLPANLLRSEQIVWSDYLLRREKGDSFNSAPYDSTYSRVTVALANVEPRRAGVVAPILSTLSLLRFTDSTGKHSAAFFAHYRAGLLNQFDVALYVDSLERARK